MYRVQRITIGRSDEADIGLAGLAVADALIGAGLDEAQQFGLQQRVHFPEFVEEQRATIGLGGGTFLICGSTGEGAAHMAENGAFHQVMRDGAAIQRHQTTVASWAELVQRVGGQFLAGAGFAGHEDAGGALGGSGDGAVNRLHRGGTADEIDEFSMFDGLAEGFHLAPQLDGAEGVFHCGGQAGGGKGFDHIVERTTPHRAHRGGKGCIGGHHDNCRPGWPSVHLFENIDTVHVR